MTTTTLQIKNGYFVTILLNVFIATILLKPSLCQNLLFVYFLRFTTRDFLALNHRKKHWQDICQFTVHFIYKHFMLYFKDVLFGFITFENQYENVYFLCNLIISLAKNMLSTNVRHFLTLKKILGFILNLYPPPVTKKLTLFCVIVL